MQLLLAKPRGFCAGVDRAIAIVELALERLGAPIYVRHEVVHNRFVVESLRARGAVFVEMLEEVPAGSTVIFSAHGVPQAVREQAQALGLQVFDATCPLVTKVHMEVVRYSRQGKECVLIGHAGHPEVEGTLGQYHNDDGGIYLIEHVADVAKLVDVVKNPEHLAYVSQTTLSMDDTAKIIEALKQQFPQIAGPRKDDICYATQNRQDAVKALTRHCDLILVVGSVNSSNSNRLRELAERAGIESYLIDAPEQIQATWLRDKHCVGLTAGASAPEVLVQAVITQLREWGAEAPVEMSGVDEQVTFALPKGLRELPQTD